MRIRIALAILLSVGLIGFAYSERFFSSSQETPRLVTVNDTNKIRDNDGFISTILATSSISIKPTQTISNSEAIGHGLIRDYFITAQKESIDNDSLQTLADKYIEAVPILTQSNTVNYSDLKTVSNTYDNFNKYASEITKIYQEHSTKLRKAGAIDLDSLDTKLYTAVSVMGDTYNETAIKLKGLAAPKALAQAHLDLINNYLFSAEGMKNISKAEEDSSSAFSGLITINQNMAEEASILAAITRILSANGI